jgi:hypothetical protein
VSLAAVGCPQIVQKRRPGCLGCPQGAVPLPDALFPLMFIMS